MRLVFNLVVNLGVNMFHINFSRFGPAYFI